jgi:hypothetical protein
VCAYVAKFSFAIEFSNTFRTRIPSPVLRRCSPDMDLNGHKKEKIKHILHFCVRFLVPVRQDREPTLRRQPHHTHKNKKNKSRRNGWIEYRSVTQSVVCWEFCISKIFYTYVRMQVNLSLCLSTAPSSRMGRLQIIIHIFLTLLLNTSECSFFRSVAFTCHR